MIYVVVVGLDEYRRVAGVFSTLEKAQAFVADAAATIGADMGPGDFLDSKYDGPAIEGYEVDADLEALYVRGDSEVWPWDHRDVPALPLTPPPSP